MPGTLTCHTDGKQVLNLREVGRTAQIIGATRDISQIGWSTVQSLVYYVAGDVSVCLSCRLVLEIL